MSIIIRHRCRVLLADVTRENRAALRNGTRDADYAFFPQLVAALQRVRGRVSVMEMMSDSDAIKRVSVFVEQIQQAPVGKLRHGQLDDSRNRKFEILRIAQQPRSLDKKLFGCLLPRHLGVERPARRLGSARWNCCHD